MIMHQQGANMPIPSVQPIHPPTEAYRDRFVALCAWIDTNQDQTISWTQLSDASGWSHNELLAMFAYFLDTTPMTYIRSVRKSARKLEG